MEPWPKDSSRSVVLTAQWSQWWLVDGRASGKSECWRSQSDAATSRRSWHCDLWWWSSTAAYLPTRPARHHVNNVDLTTLRPCLASSSILNSQLHQLIQLFSIRHAYSVSQYSMRTHSPTTYVCFTASPRIHVRQK